MAGGITNEILPAISNKENSADWRALPLGEDRGAVALTPPKIYHYVKSVSSWKSIPSYTEKKPKNLTSL